MAKQIKSEDGSITMIFVAIMATVVLATIAATTFGKLVIEQRSLQNAVDASALAGASVLLASPGNSCTTSVRIAELNHIEVKSCAASDFDVRLLAMKSVDVLGTTFELTAQARAGAA